MAKAERRDAGTSASPRRALAGAAPALVGVALVGLKLWLVSSQSRIVWGTGKNDDFTYLWRAANIIDGNWLGDFGVRTLHTGVGYPLWIALNALHPLPLYLADQLFYAAACAVFVWALSPRIGAPLALGSFVLLLFSPGSWDFEMRHLVRESIYSSQTLLVFGCAIAFFARARGPIVSLALWGALLGTFLGFSWITREEGVWLLPAILLLLLSLLYQYYLRPAPRQRLRLAISAAPVATFALVVWGVSAVNYRHYGVFCTSEMKLADFTGAIGALQRIEHERWLPYLTLPSEVIERAARHSKSFQAVAAHMGTERSLGAREGLGLLGDSRYEDEIPGGWSVWALREAAGRAGFYDSLPRARDLWRRVADEINGACASGALACGPESSSMAPPWRWEYSGPVTRSTLRGVRDLATMSGLQRYEPVSASSNGQPWQLELAARVTRDRLAPHVEVAGPAQPTTGRLAALGALRDAYQALAPWCAGSALAIWLAVALAPKLRRRSRFALIGACLLLAIATRLVLLAYVDVTSFPAVKFRFQAPLYSLLLGFVALMLGELVSLARDSSSPRDPSVEGSSVGGLSRCAEGCHKAEGPMCSSAAARWAAVRRAVGRPRCA